MHTTENEIKRKRESRSIVVAEARLSITTGRHWHGWDMSCEMEQSHTFYVTFEWSPLVCSAFHILVAFFLLYSFFSWLFSPFIIYVRHHRSETYFSWCFLSITEWERARVLSSRSGCDGRNMAAIKLSFQIVKYFYFYFSLFFLLVWPWYLSPWHPGARWPFSSDTNIFTIHRATHTRISLAFPLLLECVDFFARKKYPYLAFPCGMGRTSGGDA